MFIRNQYDGEISEEFNEMFWSQFPGGVGLMYGATDLWLFFCGL